MKKVVKILDIIIKQRKTVIHALWFQFKNIDGRK